MIKIFHKLVPRTDLEDGSGSFGEFDLPENFCTTYRLDVRVYNESYFEVFALYKDHSECIQAGLEAGFEMIEEQNDEGF